MEKRNPLDLWIFETNRDIVALNFKVNRTLFSGKSAYQKIDIVETSGHGRMLLNDGMVMLSERDEFIYHEMIAHVPLFVHPEPRRVLVIGGGDGGTVREILKHRSVERVVMVEIDGMVVDACREHLPSVGCDFDDPRFELRIEDGVEYVAAANERFDIVIVDSTDPIGPATPLFNRQFYENAAAKLTSNGILITQSESPFYDGDIQKPMFENQRPLFKRLHLYLFSNMTYPGGLWSFGFASKSLCPVADLDPDRVSRSGIPMRYYNSDVHRAAFMLPNFVREKLEPVLDPVGY